MGDTTPSIAIDTARLIEKPAESRIGDIVVGHTRDKRPVTARELEAHGAMAVLLRDALAPNLVQTLEHTPAFVHGGPFANIAHGCSSVIATRAALRLADYVVTEAGFGADLGAEKFVDIKCRKSGLRPDAAVVVATVRALKFHGGVDVPDLGREDLGAVERGTENLARHLRNVRQVYGMPCVVALNRFPADTDAEIARVVELVDALGVSAYPATHFVDGGVGATDLAKGVLDLLDDAGPSTFSFTYPDELPLKEKAWNAVRLAVVGDTVKVSLNGTEVYARPIEPTNQRFFGLFHYTDRTEARVGATSRLA